jgi:hypothetical protein
MTIRTIVLSSLVVSLAGVAACGDGLPTVPSVTYTMSGVVSTMTPTGAVPLAGVQIANGTSHRLATTDVNGFYSIGVAAAATTISASKRGYLPRTSTRTFNGDTRIDIELDARATYVLTGVITEVTATGLIPLEGVLVEAVAFAPGTYDSVSGDATTDANGRYSISGLWRGANAASLVWLTKAGFDTQGNPSCDYCYRTFVATGDTQLDIQLGRTAGSVR